MVELKVFNVDKYIYKLKDDYDKIYILNLEFLDIDNKPKVGDYIFISSELLNPKYDGYSTNYTFGNLDSKYGKSNIELTDIDVIKVKIDNIETYLKRLYG